MLALATAIAVLSTLGLTQAAPLDKRDTGVYIHPNGDPTFCLAPYQAAANGGLMNFYLCSQTQITDPTKPYYALWDISKGNQLSLKLHNTDFCLDAGSNPATSDSVHLWQCYPGAPQQQWYYTDDLHIALTGYSSCLAFGRYGTTLPQCASGQLSYGTQEFSIAAPGATTTTAVSTSSVPTKTTSMSTSAASSTSTAGSGSAGKKLYINGDKTKCLTLSGDSVNNGTPVVVAECGLNTSPYAVFQNWIYNKGQGQFQLAGTNSCLDFGTGGGSNGVGMKIWQCYPGLFQQTLYYTDDNHVAVYNGNQCLDVKAGTSDVQSWACSGTDPNQVFTS